VDKDKEDLNEIIGRAIGYYHCKLGIY